MQIRIATRQSALALWQAEHVAEKLRALPLPVEVSLLPLSTRGDEVLDRSLQKIGGKGLFIKELEIAMQEGHADIAVHSMKDVPANLPRGFCIAAVLERGNPADVLLARQDASWQTLPQGARVGSSSLRRQAQLLALRPDLAIVPLRGNVQTRIRRLDDGEYDAIVLAAAGVERLGLQRRISQVLDPRDMLPAAAQGVIGVECRDDQPAVIELVNQLTHEPTSLTTQAERAIARTLDASCHSSVAAFATLRNSELTLAAVVASADGSTVLRQSITGPSAQAVELGTRLGNQLLAAGAAKLMADSAT